MNDTEFLTVRQLAQKGILTEYMIRKLIAEKKLPHIKVSNRKYLIEYGTFLTWIESQK